MRVETFTPWAVAFGLGVVDIHFYLGDEVTLRLFYQCFDMPGRVP